MSVGSTDKSKRLTPEEQIAKDVALKTRNIAGISIQLQLHQQQIQKLHEMVSRVTNLYMTLQGEFEQFKQQRIIELQARLGHGPTAPPEKPSGDHS